MSLYSDGPNLNHWISNTTSLPFRKWCRDVEIILNAENKRTIHDLCEFWNEVVICAESGLYESEELE